MPLCILQQQAMSDIFNSINALVGESAGLHPLFAKTSSSDGYSNLTPAGGDSSSFSIKHGRIIDFWPQQGICLIVCSGSSIIKCPVSTQSHSSVSGVTEFTLPQIGDYVLVAKQNGADNGFIISSAIGAVKSEMPELSIAKEKYQKGYKLRDANEYKMIGNIQDQELSSSNFTDRWPGEKFCFNENNVGYHISKYLTRWQAGELCQVTLSALDYIASITMHNLRMLNSNFYLESMCDYGRTNTELFLSSHLEDFLKEKEEDRRAKSIHRMWSGWLAGGTHFYTHNPKRKDAESRPISDIWVDDMGTLSARSSSGVFLAKRDTIRAPLRLKRQDDVNKQGDEKIDTYSKKKESFLFVQEKREDKKRMACGMRVRDMMAWNDWGYYQIGRYEDYKKDWKKEKVTDKYKKFPELGDFWGKHGDSVELTHEQTEREGDKSKDNIKVGEAFCGLLPDGSVLLRDAWGSQIEMRGGRISISAAIGVDIFSGNTTSIFSGRDNIIKSGESCEIIGVNKDIRIRGGRNVLMEALSGFMQLTAPIKEIGGKEKEATMKDNSGASGSEVDTKGTGEGYKVHGLVFKAKDIEFVGETARFSLEKSFCVKGQKDDELPDFSVKAMTNVLWDDGGGTIMRSGDKYVVAHDGNVYMDESLYASNNGMFGGNLYVEESIVAIDGPIATNGSVISEPEDKMSSSDVPSAKDSFESACDDWDEKYLKPYKEEDYEDIRYTNRTTEEYRTKNAIWFEKFWQREFDKRESGLLEKISTFKNDEDEDEEYSYPGKQHYDGSIKSFIKYTEKNIMTENGYMDPKEPDQQNQKGGELKEEEFSKQLFFIKTY